MLCCLPRPLLTTALSAVLSLPAHATDPADPTPTPPDTATELATVQVQAQDRRPVVQVGSFGEGTLRDTPAAVRVLTRELIDRQQVRTLSELARHDAALGDSYAPVGYYQNISIRGFVLDPGTAYRSNGLTLTGEQRLALENVERVEILKGDAGLAAGVIAPGGLVNYVSKRPDTVRQLHLSTDNDGTRHAALDLGGWLTPELGLRLNLANEALRTPVAHTDGHRQFYALAADWQPHPAAQLELDISHHRSAQRSVSGYQLLGGTGLPTGIDPSAFPGFQPWQPPVGIVSTNVSLTQSLQLAPDWRARLAVAQSRSVIDDNVAFAFGCYSLPACADGESPGNVFAPDGGYDIYDFRSPDDTRRNRQLRAELHGRLAAGPLTHALTAGIEGFQRHLRQRPSVYAPVGSGHIHDDQVPVFAPSPEQPGALATRLASRQTTVFVMDRMTLTPQLQWLAGARAVQLDETAFDAAGQPERRTRLDDVLPQTALLWQPTATLSAYLSHAQGLSLGTQAPYWTRNAGTVLPARLSRQDELGLRWQPYPAVEVSAALFRLRQPHQFARPEDHRDGPLYVQAGAQRHTGLDLTATAPLGQHLHLTASVGLLHARVQGTGVAAHEGHDLVNVPPRRASLQALYTLPRHPTVGIRAGWRHAAANPATADGSVRVPAWHVFDAGVQWLMPANGQVLDWQLSVDNLANRFYWRDTGSSFGDAFLFAGAPRQARLSVRFDL